jgi:hypothetical protein
MDGTQLYNVPANANRFGRPGEPKGFTNPSCGAIPTDTHGTGEAFDGDDDSSYGSVFHAVIGINPFNPSALTQE